jgi:hypothetical protein
VAARLDDVGVKRLGGGAVRLAAERRHGGGRAHGRAAPRDGQRADAGARAAAAGEHAALRRADRRSRLDARRPQRLGDAVARALAGVGDGVHELRLGARAQRQRAAAVEQARQELGELQPAAAPAVHDRQQAREQHRAGVPGRQGVAVLGGRRGRLICLLRIERLGWRRLLLDALRPRAVQGDLLAGRHAHDIL